MDQFSKPNSGFTLIEVLTSILLMSIFTVIALTSMGSVVDDARFNQTLREMEQIRAGLTGETQRLETGLRKNYGYLGDLGALPTTAQGLAALTSKPATVTYWSATVSSQMMLNGVAYGWRGPYIYNTTQQDYTKDAWGNAYVYTDNGTYGKRIRSLGSDGGLGGTGYAQEIDILIPDSVVRGRVLGHVVESASEVMGADQKPFTSPATATITYGNGSGGTSSSTTATFTNAPYEFASVPFGYAAIRINVPAYGTPVVAAHVLGPSIVEVNKAQTAAIPVAEATTASFYGDTTQCSSSTDFAIVPVSSTGYYPCSTQVSPYTACGASSAWWDGSAKTVRFRATFSASGYAWNSSNPFYHENIYSRHPTAASRIVLTRMAITLRDANGDLDTTTTDTARGNYEWDGGSLIRKGSTSDIPARTNLTPNDGTGSTVTFLASRTYQFEFLYSATPAWSATVPTETSPGSTPDGFYFKIGCKFFEIKSIVFGDT